MNSLKIYFKQIWLVPVMIIVALFWTAVPVHAAQVVQEGDFKYEISYGEAWIRGYTGNGGDVTIPATLGGTAVTELAGSVFENCKTLTSVTIPASVQQVSTVAFSGCDNLVRISVDSENKNYTSIDGVLCDKSGTELRFYPYGRTEISFPDTVTTIGAYAFSYHPSLTQITIPNSVTKIDSSAFSYSTSLRSVTIPNSVTSIGDYAFCGCTSLKDINIPLGVKEIRASAFSYCEALTNITLPNSLVSIGYGAFNECKKLTEIKIPNSVQEIYGSLFNKCESLKVINVDTANPWFQSIDGALYNKSGTTLLSVPGGVSSVTIPGNVTKIAEGAFNRSTALTSVTIPDSVTEIGWSVFSDCTALTNVDIPNSVTKIGYKAFSGCTSLTRILIPESVMNIDEKAFENANLSIVFGVKGSYAETYANAQGITFIALGIPVLESFTTDLPSGQLVNTSIKMTATGMNGKAPYQYKFSYQLGEALTTIQDFSVADTAIFSPTLAGDYTLTVEVKDAENKTATKSIPMAIIDNSTAQHAFLSFIGKDPSGDYYQYTVEAFNNAYLAFQINPTLKSAKMYQQFLDSQCKIVALEDQAKGYMDYNATSNASLLAQMKKERFDILDYFAREDAMAYREEIDNLKVVDRDGNVS